MCYEIILLRSWSQYMSHSSWFPKKKVPTHSLVQKKVNWVVNGEPCVTHSNINLETCAIVHLFPSIRTLIFSCFTFTSFLYQIWFCFKLKKIACPKIFLKSKHLIFSFTILSYDRLEKCVRFEAELRHEHWTNRTKITWSY